MSPCSSSCPIGAKTDTFESKPQSPRGVKDVVKVVYQRIVSDEGSSFVFLDKKARHFRGAYHFHPEYEITMITAGRGMRVVGDSLAEFGPGDLVLMGSNLPHQYVSDSGEPAGARAFVIQF